MPNIRKILTLIIIAFSIVSCGFKPTLSKNASGYKALTEIRVVGVEGADRLKLKRIIDEEFYNDLQQQPKYDLKISITSTSYSMGVMKDSQITRYRIKSDLNYTLIDTETKKIIDSGGMFLNGSYDSAKSDFANFIAERQVSDALVKELSKELKNRLSLIISDIEEKKGEDRS